MTSAYRFLLVALLLLTSNQSCSAQGARSREQIPDLDSLPDVTAELQKQIDDNDGNLTLAGAERYRITKPLLFDLTKIGAAVVKANGGATIVMDGPGP